MTRPRRRGLALITALVMIVVLSILAWAYLNVTQSSMMQSYHQASHLRAFNGAEAGIRYYMTLAQTDKWNQKGVYTFSLDTADVTVKVMNNTAGIVVKSTGTSGSATSVVEIVLSSDGYVLRRLEQ